MARSAPGYVPFAAFGITVFTWDFGATAIGAGGLHLANVAAMLHSPTGWRMLVDLLLLAVCGGLYSVPLYAIVQEQSEPSHRARTIAANNIVNAVMMVLGAGSSPASRPPACPRRACCRSPPSRISPSRSGSFACCRRPSSGRCSNGISGCSTKPASRAWKISPPPAIDRSW